VDISILMHSLRETYYLNWKRYNYKTNRIFWKTNQR